MRISKALRAAFARARETAVVRLESAYVLKLGRKYEVRSESTLGTRQDRIVGTINFPVFEVGRPGLGKREQVVAGAVPDYPQ